jgi:LPXTG-motif cell wall-anchored protein
VWGLLGVHAKQQASALPGAGTAANVALVLAALVALTALAAGVLGWRTRRGRPAG